ncbi:unnamed protein product [Calicophoron daubneyi]|uniref:Cytosol aminopeptidase domain-containing protein n=1 Tax=Calicophoron daubneyi TaxID=300641 RepID=A0AAV2T1Z5_CALDB
MEHLQTVQIIVQPDLGSPNCDSVVLVLEDISVLPPDFKLITPTLESQNKIVTKFSTGVHVLHCDGLPSGRLVVSFTGPMDREYDDMRRVVEAAKEGMSQALKAGSVKPLLALAPLKTVGRIARSWNNPKALSLSTLLGALQSLYVPLEVREFSERSGTDPNKTVKATKAESLSWFSYPQDNLDHDKLIQVAWALEEGRRVARDIGGSDPERMCASRIVDYLKAEMTDKTVKMDVQPVDAKLYPLAAVVDRGSNERHRGVIVHLDYSGPTDSAADTASVTNLFLVGKGIVYDTGGSDIKHGGNMVTMHRDKCGAAAVAGMVKTASILKAKNINLHCGLAIIRNSYGENAYVSDEIIVSRAGLRIRVTNTDAEGRMVMTDLLCEAKEKALKVPNPHLMTVATLTGHVTLSYGTWYTALVCNGTAHEMHADNHLQLAGSLLGEMSEISTIRREDYEAHSAAEEYADLRNSSRPVGGRRCRGHQSPAAFMILASGLDSHMLGSEHPLPYTHFDIAGSMGPCPGIPSGVPILTLSSQYLLNDFWKQESNTS